MARYCDGQTALSHAIAIAAAQDGIIVAAPQGNAHWAWSDIERADDGADDGDKDIVFKRRPDTGERLTLETSERAEIEARAPHLFKQSALKRESAELTAGLIATAASLAAIFFIGVPFAAQPIAHLIPSRYQAHLGDLAWTQVNALTEQCEGAGAYSSAGWSALDGMYARLKSHANGPPAGDLHVVHANFPNAFTLPDNSIVITDELISLADGPDQIAAVIAHELGHVEAGHVLENVVRQLGLGMFVDIVFGGAGAGQTIAAINVLALRYTRGDEEEADRIALRIMDEAALDPGAVAALFRRLARFERDAHATAPEFLSSHPDSMRRAEAAARLARPGRAPVMSAYEWQAVRALCSGEVPAPKGAPAAPPVEKGPKTDPKAPALP